jgi:Flp pilus assembly secretin CpaC
MATRRLQAFRGGLAALAVLATALPALAATEPAELVEVQLDKAKILRMPPHAATIVVGNPIIADVTTLKADGLIVVTGKGFGETNLIFLDNTGTAVEEANIRVTAATSLLTVQRGMDRESYSCRPRCQPTVSLGDADTFLKGNSSQITSRNSLAVPTSH